MQLLTRNNLQLAAYGLFIVVVMLLPLFMDVFWLNRMSKYLVSTPVEDSAKGRRKRLPPGLVV